MNSSFWHRLILRGPVCLALGLILAGMSPASPQVTPKPGSKDRKAIMDALRVPVQKDLQQKVVFKVDHLKILQGWAHLRGVPQQPSGKPVDYDRTRYAQARKEGAFDDWICALLKKKQGKWQVVTYVIGATDVAWDGWDKEFGAPGAIFK